MSLTQDSQANAPPAAISLMASGDATHFRSGNLTQLDLNSLSAFLAQLDSMRNTVVKLVEGSALVPAQEATPQNSQRGDSAMQMD